MRSANLYLKDDSNLPSGFASTETGQALTNAQLQGQLNKWGLDKDQFYQDIYSEDSATRNNMLADAHVQFIS